MSEIVVVKLKAETDAAVKNVKKVDKAVKETSKAVKKASKELSGMQQVGNAAVSQLDKMTGGLASKLLAVGKAAKLSGKAMKTALISSGIGLAVVALALIVEYWDQISSLVDGVSGEQAKALQATKDTLAAQEQQLDTISKSENILKLQGKTEKEIVAMKRQITDESIATTKILLEQQKQTKKSQVEAAERNQKIAAGIIAFLTLPLTLILGMVDGITLGLSYLPGMGDIATSLAEDFTMGIAGMVFDPEQVKEDGEDTIAATEEALLKLENTRAGYLVKDKEDAKKNAEDKKNNDINAEKERAAAIERIRKGLIDTEAEQRAEKLRLIKEDYTQQLTLAEEYYGKESEKVKELKAAQKAALDAQQEVFNEQDRIKEKQRLDGIQSIVDATLEETEVQKLEKEQADAEAELIRLGTTTKQKADVKLFYENEIKNAKKANADEEEKNERLKTNAQLDMAKSTFGNISGLFDKQSAAGKASAAAAALINTYQGITAELATKTVTPFEFGIKIANIATTAAIGFKSVKDILKTSPSNASGSGSNPAAGAGGPQPPAFNVVGASGSTQLADAIGGQTQRPSRAYVVSNDVSTAQELDRNIIEGASI
tara:strand:- start:703 stop:2508 length:1806 start_codon:yes stop_codon:yes gene_type:complete